VPVFVGAEIQQLAVMIAVGENSHSVGSPVLSLHEFLLSSQSLSFTLFVSFSPLLVEGTCKNMY
jgi:hypothetical protein